MKLLLPIIISIMVISLLIPGYAQTEDGWYLGKGLKVGDYFEYNLCHIELNDCSNINFKIWIKGENPVTNTWIAEVVVFDGNKIIKGDMELGKITAEPVESSSNLSKYSYAFKHSIAWLSGYTSSSFPTDFGSNSFIRTCTLSCTQLIPQGLETITVPAGIFNTQVLTYGNNNTSKIWG